MKNIEEKIFLYLQYQQNMKSRCGMSACYACGKEKLSKDEVGITKKLLGKAERKCIVYRVWLNSLKLQKRNY